MSDDRPYNPPNYWLLPYQHLAEMVKRMAEMQIEINEANADITRLMQERKALREQLAAAQQDAERYQFMRDKLVTIQYHIPFAQDGIECSVKTFGRLEAHKPTLDEAIDAIRAAIAAAKEEA